MYKKDISIGEIYLKIHGDLEFRPMEKPCRCSEKAEKPDMDKGLIRQYRCYHCRKAFYLEQEDIKDRIRASCPFCRNLMHLKAVNHEDSK